MNWNIFQWRSLKTRVTLITLAIFLIGIWLLAFYASRMLREDMQRLLGEQQFSTVSFMAAEVNHELKDRLEVLENVAGIVSPVILGNAAALQSLLEQRLILRGAFNGGVIAFRLDGTAIAEVPLSAGRIGVNYMDVDTIAAALKQGKSTIGRPAIGKKLLAPVLSMTAPIRDTQGKVIGALAGVTDLSKPSLLDVVTESRYGKSGGYLLIAPQYRMVVTATDKSRIMEVLPAPGINQLIDRFILGDEGSAVVVNPLGVEVLASAKGVPVAGWLLSALLPAEEAFAPIRAMQQRMLIATIFLTILAGALTWWMLKRQLSPMLAAVETLVTLSDTGKPPQPLPIARQDEIGQLIGGFNHLLETLAQREDALKKSERLLSEILENVDACIYLKDTQGRYLYANRLVRELFGASVEDVVGQSDEKFFDAETAVQLHNNERPVLEEGETVRTEDTNLNLKDGRTSTYLSVKLPLRNEIGEIYALCGISTDITERKRAELLRSEQGRVLEMIVTSTPLEQVLESLMVLMESQLEGIMASILLLEDDGLHLRHGAAPSLPQAYTQAIDGLRIGAQAGSCGTAVHRREQVIVSDILQDPLWDDYRKLAAAHGLRSCWSTPIITTHQGKLLGTLALYSQEVRTPTLMEGQLSDMATRLAGIAIERKETEERISHMAHHDALTGLPNRILLEDRLKQAMLYADRYDRQVTVAFMDLDKFKLINDSLGHKAGDEILKTVADRISYCVRATDTVVRLGGDEFVIILFDQPNKAEAVTPTLQRICATIAQAIYIGGQKLEVTYSMGLATYPGDGADVETLLMNADAAMYRAKELGRNNYQFYTAEMNAKVHEKLALQEGLRNAIAGSEFLLLYQPQVDLKSGQIFGVEALIRWQHPEWGMVSPIDFIPMAEDTGLIVPIGDWVLRTACRQNKAWQDAGMPPITMSVNVSSRQFKERSLVSRVAHALQESGLEARYLELELTESLIMQDLQQAIATMQELQVMGVQLAIDDFGTGYSSLSALKSFPIVRLKIDQSFVRQLPDDEDDKAIAMAVISLGHKLNLKVIAEGVETEQQLEFLRDNDCDEMQGYHFSKPVSADEIATLFQTAAQKNTIG